MSHSKMQFYRNIVSCYLQWNSCCTLSTRLHSLHQSLQTKYLTLIDELHRIPTST